MIAHIDSLFELFSTFPDEQACLDRLRSIRWRDGEFCPQCGDHRVYHFSDRKSFKCGACRRRFSMKVGTIFEDTKLPLRKWFIAIWMLTNHPKGIASTTLAKDLKITQKSAWFVLHRLRYAAQTKSFNTPLKGIVESDAMFVGGKNKDRHADDGKPALGGVGKVVVLGYVEREGELRAERAKNNNAKAVRDGVRRNVQPASKLMTDGRCIRHYGI